MIYRGELDGYKRATFRTIDNYQTYEFKLIYDNYTITYTERNNVIISYHCDPDNKESQERIQKILEYYKELYKEKQEEKKRGYVPFV